VLAILQFDATSTPAIERLMAEGRLPRLAELRSRGQWHSLGRSTPLFVEAGGYVTTYSGVEIEEHGIYSAFQWSAEEQRIRFFDQFPGPAGAWERLSRAGRRSLVIDQYESWVPTETDGLRMLNGWQSRHKLTAGFSAPRRENRALERRLGRSPMIEFPYGRPSPATLERLTRAFETSSGRLVDAVTELAAERFDLIWLTFSGAHYAGHHLWQSADPSGLDPVGRSESQQRLEDIYAGVDEALGRIVAALPDGTDLIVCSPLGMAANRSRTDLLPGMLAAVLAGKPLSASDGSAGPGSWIWRLRGKVPAEWRAAATRPLPPKVVRAITSRMHLRGVDWSRTRAFALPGDHSGYIRLNLRGREREGVVDPGEADALMDEIADGLATFTDPDGAPAVASVHRIAQHLAPGAKRDRLPDLVVEWSDRPSLGVTGASSPRFGDVARRGAGTSRPGNHTPHAWAVVVPGHSRPAQLSRPPRITDIAATACALVGADTTGLAGEPLLEAV
jgi:predicted AlkP superfamily phosphohydrolase/phosphomutase